MPRGRPRKEVIDEIRNRTAPLESATFDDRAKQREAEARAAFEAQAAGGEAEEDEVERLARAHLKEPLPVVENAPTPRPAAPRVNQQGNPVADFTYKAYEGFLDRGVDPDRAASLTVAYALVELAATIKSFRGGK